MKLNELARELRFDKRIIEWGARYGAITYNEYQKYLESLPDLSDNKEDITDPVQVVETNTVKVPSKGSSPVPVQTAEKSTVRNTIPFFE